MSSEELFETLNFLEENRLLGIEADAKLDPFRDQHYALGLIYDESSRTIGTRFDRAYEQGYTLVCKLEEDERLKVTVLMLPEDNDKVDAMSTGDIFEANLKVLDYDTLYQRPVFGQALEEGGAPEQKEEPSETTSEATTTQEPEQQTELQPEPVPAPQPQPEPVPAPAPTPQPEPQPEPQPKPQPEQAPPAQELPPTKAKPTPPSRPKRKEAPKPKRTRARQKDKKPRLRRIKKLKDKLSMARSKECPNGHGPIKNRFGLMQCAVCGWSPKTNFQGLPEPDKNEEQEGCATIGKIGFWLFILFIVAKSCT